MNPERIKLSEAVKTIGICKDMCPELERVQRIVEKDVSAPEYVSSSKTQSFALLTRLDC